MVKKSDRNKTGDTEGRIRVESGFTEDTGGLIIPETDPADQLQTSL